MKTQGMAHQLTALERMAGRAEFALFMEQGTGKTWTFLADAERCDINGLLVVAPKGVHLNWINKEIPEHFGTPCVARAWRSGAGKRKMAEVEEVFDAEFGVLAINFDALITKKGADIARRFLKHFDAMLVVDESTRIKNPEAGRTKALMKLRPLAKIARIGTGTPITNAPVDVFSQMEFLEEGLLGTSSYRAFVAEYAELMSVTHPMIQNMIRRNPKAAYAQIVERNPDGTPRWKNLDKLQRLLQPHSFRVLKKECLDLPDKIYQRHPFELLPQQQKVYRLMKDEMRMEVDGELEAVNALAAANKLQQITSGFLIASDGKPFFISEGNPRLSALFDLLEDIDGQFIVWAYFKEELRIIANELSKRGFTFVSYHGSVNPKDREAAVETFQSGQARCFLGQPKAGGLGLTLTNAETVIYYSNNYNLETRLQSEDRAHRIGTKKNVVYIDLVAENTIDEIITRALQRKENLAAAIIGGLNE